MGVFGRKSASRLAPAALKVITAAEIGSEPIWRRVEPLDKQQKAVVAKMMKKLKSLADENDIAQGLLGTRKDIEGLFRYRESAKLLSGWRAQVVGRPLLELLDSVEG
jgi:ribonuclease D